MQLYLHGGVNTNNANEVTYYYSLLKQTLEEQKPKQFLHLPFARTGIYTKDREATQPINMQPFIEGLGIEYLDGRYLESYEHIDTVFIYMNGGNDIWNLHHQITRSDVKGANFIVSDIINRAQCVFGDSAGAMICGNLVCSLSNSSRISSGLSLIDTFIIPHFSERHSEEKARQCMQTLKILDSLCIDENTIVKTSTKSPSDYSIFGKGSAKLITL